MLALPLGTFEAIEYQGNRVKHKLLVDEARLPDIFIYLITVGKIDILIFSIALKLVK